MNFKEFKEYLINHNIEVPSEEVFYYFLLFGGI